MERKSEIAAKCCNYKQSDMSKCAHGVKCSNVSTHAAWSELLNLQSEVSAECARLQSAVKWQSEVSAKCAHDLQCGGNCRVKSQQNVRTICSAQSEISQICA